MASALSGTRALVVEDDSGTSLLLKTVLCHEGSEVECVYDGKAAMSRLDAGRYDVVLLDLFMPVADGIQVLEHLRTREPSLLRRVIVLTAASTKDIALAGELNAFQVFRKPFPLEDLLNAIRQCVVSGTAADRPGTVK